jgi:hypothetical protein
MSDAVLSSFAIVSAKPMPVSELASAPAEDMRQFFVHTSPSCDSALELVGSLGQFAGSGLSIMAIITARLVRNHALCDSEGVHFQLNRLNEEGYQGTSSYHHVMPNSSRALGRRQEDRHASVAILQGVGPS